MVVVRDAGTLLLFPLVFHVKKKSLTVKCIIHKLEALIVAVIS